MDTIQLESREDLKTYLETTTCETTILKFTATWCNPCKQIQPVVIKMASENMGSILFCEIDIEVLDELAMDLKVSSIPAFHAYVCGKKVDEFVGANSQKLADLIERTKRKFATNSSRKDM